MFYQTIFLLKRIYSIIRLRIGTTDWAKFAQEWRMGYWINVFVVSCFFFFFPATLFDDKLFSHRIASGGLGPSSVDVMHREVNKINK